MCPQPVRQLRTEIGTLQTAMNSMLPLLDTTSTRLIKQFQSQLAAVSATVLIAGGPQAGASTLVRVLSGEWGSHPRLDGPSRLRHRALGTGALSIEPPFLKNLGVLPVRLTENPAALDPQVLRQRAELTLPQEVELEVVVLEADRLLSSVDLSLVRLLKGGASQKLILFVNQIDALSNPAVEIPAIKAKLVDMIARHCGAAKPVVVFGSLLWAEAALQDRLAMMAQPSKEALLTLAEVADVEGDDHAPSFVWQLSGVPQLVTVIGSALAESPLKRVLGKVRRQLRAVLGTIDAPGDDQGHNVDHDLALQLAVEEITRRSEAVSHRLLTDLHRQSTAVCAQFLHRINRIAAQYTETAVAEVTKRLNQVNGLSHWEVDSFRLRLQIRSACLAHAQSCRALCDRMLRRAARELTMISRDVFDSVAPVRHPEPALGTFVSVRTADGRVTGPEIPTGTWLWKPAVGQQTATKLRDFRVFLAAHIETQLSETEQRQLQAPVEAMRLRLAEYLAGQTGDLLAQANDNHGAITQQAAPFVSEQYQGAVGYGGAAAAWAAMMKRTRDIEMRPSTPAGRTEN